MVADGQYRTNAKGVYAVGDVLGGPQFTHTSWDDHRLLFDILLGASRRSRFERFIPYTAFTDPQVAGVGLTEKEARERGVAFESAGMPFGDIARAVETARPMIDAARHELTVTLPDGPVWVDADVVRLAQVVSNLLHNAAKYTDTGGRIRLTAGREGDNAVVRVVDTGQIDVLAAA